MYEYEVKQLSDLIPYANNSRTHSDQQVSQVAASIKEFGFTNPVLIDEDGGIIAGHGRVMAAKKLKLKEVPCIVLAGLTDAQRKAYVIADNQLALNAGWDDELLKVEIEGLKALDFNIDLLGFENSFVSEILEIEQRELEDNPYTDKMDGLTYEPTGENYTPSETFTSDKVLSLLAEIENSPLQDDEKSFLRAAATRHYCFYYSKIADLYATSGKEMQELMEKSALVIVDYDKAIENGYTKLKEVIGEDYNKTVK